MEESPEQILARLARYQVALQRPSRSPLSRVPGSFAGPTPSLPPRAQPVARGAVVAPTPVAPTPVAPVPQRVWRHEAHPPLWKRNAIAATTLGQLLGLLACVVALLAFSELDQTIAFAVVATLGAMGLYAIARRVPLALWWTLGVVIGGALGRFS